MADAPTSASSAEKKESSILAGETDVKEQKDANSSAQAHPSASNPNPTPASLSVSPSNSLSPFQPSSSSTLDPTMTTATATTYTAATPPIAQPVPTKPRSNSQLQSTRPAPPSPAPSRPGSQIFSPVLHPSSPSSSLPRDRASSTSSSRGGGSGGVRRVSNSSHPSRTSSKPRPRSALGASSFLPSENDESPFHTPTAATTTNTSTSSGDPSLASTPIPENAPAPSATASPPSVPLPASPPSREESPKSKDQEVIIRDFAFKPSDSRFAGPGLPLSAPDYGNSSRSSSKWGWGSSDSPEPGSSGPSSRKGSGWGGFGLLSWRGLMGKSRRNSSNDQGDEGEEDEENDYPITVPDHDEEDDYAFSESELGSGTDEDESEPWGFYRAAYAFDPQGEHEIGLEEGDIIEVRGRGGGDGWVVAVKRQLDQQGRVLRLDDVGEGEGKEGLVPETYLEKAGDVEMAPRKSEQPADKPTAGEGA